MTESEALMALAFLLVLEEEEDRLFEKVADQTPWGEWADFNENVYQPFESELFWTVHNSFGWPYNTGVRQVARVLKWAGL